MKQLKRSLTKDLNNQILKLTKGSRKPVKQGSSDVEKIEGGKGEVVKPEEKSVDKDSVDSVKSASNVKGVSNDPQQKGVQNLILNQN